MSFLHRFVYATLLAFTAFNLAPSLASAQAPASGKFTLPHDVYWQSAFVPAGEYRFNYDPGSGLGVLTVSSVNGTHAGFMFIVRDEEATKPTDLSRLLLEKTAAGSYVEALQLPEFGMTLHFAAPSSVNQKLVTMAAAGASAR
jgi:hypothetical protein